MPPPTRARFPSLPGTYGLKALSLFSPIISSNPESTQQIPSDEFLCVRFRIFELFQVGFLSPATFTVYEYHRPGNPSDSLQGPSSQQSLHRSFREKLTYLPHVFSPPESTTPPLVSSYFAESSVIAVVTLRCSYLLSCCSHQTQTQRFHPCAPSDPTQCLVHNVHR